MLFSSTTFIFVFLPIVLAFYYLILKKHRTAQNVFLSFASLLFYAWGGPKYALLMMLSIAANWFFGVLVDMAKKKEKAGRSKLWVGLSVAFNLGMLYIFKYLTFTATIFANIFGIPTDSIPQIVLPIGISFFTFQAMSYVIDVYRGRGEVQKNPLNVALYISFFPQLIAGPIVRYETVAYEMKNRRETADDFLDGFSRFVIGFAKKVMISNTLSVYADAAFGDIASLSVAGSWLGAICYTFQIFFDFSGYSDMAIGLGKMFGFHFLENFNYPYISRSITEFWRRWHMSLGSWFRDYLYIPLGGSRVKKSRMIFNLFVVWLATGVWHGANWTFLVWGLLYFVLLMFEKLTGLDKVETGKAANAIRWGYTMLFVVLGWVLFRAESLSEAGRYMASMFGFGANGVVDAVFVRYIISALPFLLAGVLFSMPTAKWIKEKINTERPIWQITRALMLVLAFGISFASIIAGSHNPFIYFNF